MTRLLCLTILLFALAPNILFAQKNQTKKLKEVDRTEATHFINIKENQKIKRGKVTSIEWAGPDKELTLELLKNGLLMFTLEKDSPNKSFQWLIPNGFVKGEYQLVLKSKGGNIEASSNKFKIVAKVGLFVKMLPVFALGGTAYYFLRPPPPEKLPGPIDPNS